MVVVFPTRITILVFDIKMHYVKSRVCRVCKMKIISLEMKLEMRDLILDRISQHLFLDALIESISWESSRSIITAKISKDRVVVAVFQYRYEIINYMLIVCVI